MPDTARGVSKGRPFLTAQWRWLAMLNWRVDPALLAAHLPPGTELDSRQGAHFVSLVGFLFRDTRVMGVPIPLHRNFEEVNLRFYVRRTVAGEVRRGVTFLQELVPRGAIAAVARLAYNEPYRSLGMRHRLELDPFGVPRRAEYAWRESTGWNALTVEPVRGGSPIVAGSDEEFFADRHWGYTRQRDGGTVEYHVEHPRWKVWSVSRATVEGDLAATYGPAMARALAGEPSSAFLADGSKVAVDWPNRIGI